MKKLLYFAAAAMIAAIAGCTEDIIAPDNQEGFGQETVPTGNDSGLLPHKTIKVSSADTKTSLSGLQILWDKGDQISLFNQDGQTCTYTLVGEGGQTYGDFETETEPETGYKYAIYPAVEGQAEGSSVAVKIPAVQTYDGENFPAPYPMAAVSSDGENFSFTNLATVISLDLVGDASVKRISITAAGGEKIAGDALVDCSGEIPSLSISGEGSSTVTLEIGKAVTLSAVPSGFKFIVAPGTYSDGFRITVTDDADKTTEIATAAAEVTLTAGTIKNFGGTMGVYASDFENIYIIGDGTFYEPWNTKIMDENPAGSEWTSAFTKGENGIYTWTGVLAPGTFKFPWKDSLNDFFGVEDGKLIYHPEGTAGDQKYTVGAPGKYEITINVNKLTFNIKALEEYSIPDNLYLFGDGTGAGWSIDHGEKMVKRPDLKFENNADGEGVFYMVTRLGAVEGDSGFKFLETHTGEDFNAGYQFAWGLSKIWKNGSDRKYNRVKENGMYSIKVDTKYWNYEVLKMTGENPAEIYIYGDATGYGWDLGKTAADETQKLTSTDGVIYSWTGKLLKGEFKFAFGGMYLSPEGAPALSFDNGFLVTGNDAEGWKVTVRTDMVDDTKYTVSEEGNYTVTINTDTMDLSVRKN